jgi:hypothetical protein
MIDVLKLIIAIIIIAAFVIGSLLAIAGVFWFIVTTLNGVALAFVLGCYLVAVSGVILILMDESGFFD